MKMKRPGGSVLKRLVSCIVFTGAAFAAPAQDGPPIIGKAAARVKSAECIMRSDFKESDWCPQIAKDGGKSYAKFANGSLDLLNTKGATVWYRQKISGRVAISYTVTVCTEGIAGLTTPTDLNAYWMANTPFEKSIFDDPRYDGNFNSYHPLLSYYASTGGRTNKTTRMRRYPRVIGTAAVEHVALADKDQLPGYLITPDVPMRVTVVACDDLVQYIVNGKLVYEMEYGDEVTVASGEDGAAKARYTPENFPFYASGYFGFRTVASHHLYSDFSVWRLLP